MKIKIYEHMLMVLYMHYLVNNLLENWHKKWIFKNIYNNWFKIQMKMNKNDIYLY